MSFVLSRRVGATLLWAAACVAGSAQAQHTVLLGSDYLTTVDPTFFAATGPLKGLPIGPGLTDTIVQRREDCMLSLTTGGSSCTIPIEMVALSLQSTTNPMVLVRESPTLASTGSMTLMSDGSGTGGTFVSSFFDVFFELSLDGGATWMPDSLPLSSGVELWTTITPPSPPAILVGGPVGSQAASFHTSKSATQFDFYPVDVIPEQHPGAGIHSVIIAQIPEPGALPLVALAMLTTCVVAGARRKS